MSINHMILLQIFSQYGACEQVDDMINACTDNGGECDVCASIICPHYDKLHFHHDGCPSCSESCEISQGQPHVKVLYGSSMPKAPFADRRYPGFDRRYPGSHDRRGSGGSSRQMVRGDIESCSDKYLTSNLTWFVSNYKELDYYLSELQYFCRSRQHNPFQEFWRCRHYPDSISNWDNLYKPSRCLVCRTPPHYGSNGYWT
jgi:hypothetical protein